ncbi:MAG TPA: hypothetical protein VHB50_05340, partial [Bryobacteraceae bacterium]|nr:hypothetical protein [Bryobacteraceae bacterium]
MTRRGQAIACAVFALALSGRGTAAQNVPQVLSTISGTTQFRESVVSPDGHWLAWTVTLRNKDNTASRNSAIWLLDLTKPGTAARRIAG